MTVFFIFHNNNCDSQSTYIKKFKNLPFPEKWWVITHPFVAKKALAISSEAIEVTQSMKKDTCLDGDFNGGQLDAFRHSYWMARLTQEIGWRRSKKLGNAHEKGNYKQYKKGQSEDGSLPDSAMCHMDFLNNDTGIEIGLQNKNASSEKIAETIREMILEGKLYIMYKNEKKQYLSCDGNLIDNSSIKKWNVPKCIKPSNYKIKR